MRRLFTSEVKIGLTVVAALVVFFWGMNYLKGINLFKPTNYYYVNYSQVDGLVKSSPVMLDGFQVGLVRDIQYRYDQPGNILVTLSLNRKLRLPEGSSATIEGALMGNPAVTLNLGPLSAPLLEAGDSLTGLREPSLLDQLSSGLLADVEALIQRTDSMVAGVETLLNNGSLANSLRSIEHSTGELERLTVSLNRTMDNDLPSILTNIDNLTGTFAQVGRQLNALDLHATLNKVDNTLEGLGNLTQRLNRTDNSLGLLLNTPGLYHNLDSTLISTNRLLLDLREHPKRYVHFSLFGRGNKP
ncbi:MAG: MCE family protein [Bacteroidales bacterium]|jgi:phospholipid/cholesterol/gamma-HCH transport system substrate-binding protein|nr:MCE family protein [Bacteroidales bacterium]HBL72104.1 MCE family protein [Bacteroidales bacterium]